MGDAATDFGLVRGDARKDAIARKEAMARHPAGKGLLTVQDVLHLTPAEADVALDRGYLGYPLSEGHARSFPRPVAVRPEPSPYDRDPSVLVWQAAFHGSPSSEVPLGARGLTAMGTE